MPNYVTNVLALHGDSAQIRAMLEAIQYDDLGSLICFSVKRVLRKDTYRAYIYLLFYYKSQSFAPDLPWRRDAVLCPQNWLTRRKCVWFLFLSMPKRLRSSISA